MLNTERARRFLMKFYVPINEAEPVTGEDGNGSVTIHVVDTGSDVARTNKRKLREYFLEMGVKSSELKKVFKAMKFTGSRLGR